MTRKRISKMLCVLAVLACSSAVGIGLGSGILRISQAEARAEPAQLKEEVAAPSSLPSKLFRVRIAGDEVFSMSVEVVGPALAKMPRAGNDPRWDVVSYRPSEDRSKVEHYEVIGQGYKVSDNDLAVVIPDGKRKMLAQEVKALTSSDPLTRRAFLFVPKTATFAKKTFASQPYADFMEEVKPELDASGFVAFPVEHGVVKLTGTCSCKGFFGGTSGCTSGGCNSVIAGFCQSDSNCKATDSITSCSCQK